MERSLDWLTAVLAIFKAGGVYMPLDVKAPMRDCNRCWSMRRPGCCCVPRVMCGTRRWVLPVVRA
ncbi:amino acid adenylation domain-containing protein [Pseudomonas syringae]|nr:amino acid adenylation domain-containing protein [Pseudomonas syringae]